MIKISNLFDSAQGGRGSTFDSGFSLIEVVITLSIMATLLTIGAISYRSAQKGGRSSGRRADLRRIQGALEAYYADNHSYPGFGVYNCDTSDWVGVADLVDVLVTGKKYIEELPIDPSDDVANGFEYRYCVFNSGVCYCLSAQMENEDEVQVDGECGPPSGYNSEQSNGRYVTCP